MVAPDLIGFGLSERSQRFSYSLPDHTAALKSLLDHVVPPGSRPVRLVVHDYGGPVGLPLLLDEPQRFSALVLMNTFLWPLSIDPDFKRNQWMLRGPLMRWLYRRWNFSARVMVSASWGTRTPLSRERHQRFLRMFPDAESRIGTLGFLRATYATDEYIESLWQKRAALVFHALGPQVAGDGASGRANGGATHGVPASRHRADGGTGDSAVYEPPLGTVGNIEGPLEACAGAVLRYSVSPVAGAGAYIWDGPPGTLVNGEEVPQTVLAPGGSLVEVTIPSQSGTLCVQAANSCKQNPPCTGTLNFTVISDTYRPQIMLDSVQGLSCTESVAQDLGVLVLADAADVCGCVSAEQGSLQGTHIGRPSSAAPCTAQRSGGTDEHQQEGTAKARIEFWQEPPAMYSTA